MWRQIAEAGDIHFLWLQSLSQRSFQREYRIHKNFPVSVGKIGKLFYVLVPDDATKARIGRTISARHPYHPPFVTPNNQFAAVTIAEFARVRLHASRAAAR